MLFLPVHTSILLLIKVMSLEKFVFFPFRERERDRETWTEGAFCCETALSHRCKHLPTETCSAYRHWLVWKKFVTTFTWLRAALCCRELKAIASSQLTHTQESCAISGSCVLCGGGGGLSPRLLLHFDCSLATQATKLWGRRKKKKKKGVYFLAVSNGSSTSLFEE